MDRLTNSNKEIPTLVDNAEYWLEVYFKLKDYEDLEELIGVPLEELAKIFRQHIPDGCQNPKKAIVLTDGDVDKWRKYKYLEEQGRLIKLPCKVGDTIYAVGVLGFETVEEYRVIRVDYHGNLATNRSEFYTEALIVSEPMADIGFYDKEFGKTVFLTKSKAEERLKELKELRCNND